MLEVAVTKFADASATVVFNCKYLPKPSPVCQTPQFWEARFLTKIHFGAAPKPCPTVNGEPELGLVYLTTLNPDVVLAETDADTLPFEFVDRYFLV